MTIFEIEDLRIIMLESAGEAEAAEWNGDILDARFDELGYDSIAMMEIINRVQRELGTQIGDEAIELKTPRALLDHVDRILPKV